ncbi:MAG: hypothetical protein AAB340_01665 [Patescibacteria group bacterium]
MKEQRVTGLNTDSESMRKITEEMGLQVEFELKTKKPEKNKFSTTFYPDKVDAIFQGTDDQAKEFEDRLKKITEEKSEHWRRIFKKGI